MTTAHPEHLPGCPTGVIEAAKFQFGLPLTTSLRDRYSSHATHFLLPSIKSRLTGGSLKDTLMDRSRSFADFPDILLNFGDVLQQQGFLQEAEILYEQAAKKTVETIQSQHHSHTTAFKQAIQEASESDLYRSRFGSLRVFASTLDGHHYREEATNMYIKAALQTPIDIPPETPQPTIVAERVKRSLIPLLEQRLNRTDCIQKLDAFAHNEFKDNSEAIIRIGEAMQTYGLRDRAFELYGKAAAVTADIQEDHEDFIKQGSRVRTFLVPLLRQHSSGIELKNLVAAYVHTHFSHNPYALNELATLLYTSGFDIDALKLYRISATDYPGTTPELASHKQRIRDNFLSTANHIINSAVILKDRKNNDAAANERLHAVITQLYQYTERNEQDNEATEALSYARKWVDTQPQINFRVDLHIFRQLHDPDVIKAHVREYTTKFHNNQIALEQIATILYAKGLNDEAVDCLVLASTLTSKPNYMEAMTLYSQEGASVKDYLIPLLRTHLEQDPEQLRYQLTRLAHRFVTNPFALNEIGHNLNIEGYIEDALSHFAKAACIAPRDTDAQEEYFHIYKNNFIKVATTILEHADITPFTPISKRLYELVYTNSHHIILKTGSEDEILQTIRIRSKLGSGSQPSGYEED